MQSILRVANAKGDEAEVRTVVGTRDPDECLHLIINYIKKVNVAVLARRVVLQFSVQYVAQPVKLLCESFHEDLRFQ